MKIPGIGLVTYKKNQADKTINGNINNPAFKGRVDTEMRNILVDRTIICNKGHSGYTTYYSNEHNGTKTDELYRMVNIYRPYSWEQTTPYSPLGTPNFTTYSAIAGETMIDQKYGSGHNNNDFVEPHGFWCELPEIKPDREAPDYLEETPFRLTPPVRYENGRPVYKTGEAIYQQNEYRKEYQNLHTKIWQGAIGEIGKPLNRLESLEDKLSKLERIKKENEVKDNKSQKEYQSYIDTAGERSVNSWSSKNSRFFADIQSYFLNKKHKEWEQNNKLDLTLNAEIKRIKEEIQKIKEAKSRGQYLDLSTKELYENSNIVEAVNNMPKVDYNKARLISLPDRTVGSYWLSQFSKNQYMGLTENDEKAIREHIDKIMYPERASSLAESLTNRKEMQENNTTDTLIHFLKKDDRRY